MQVSKERLRRLGHGISGGGVGILIGGLMQGSGEAIWAGVLGLVFGLTLIARSYSKL